MDQERLSHAKDVSNGDTENGQSMHTTKRRRKRNPLVWLASRAALCGAWIVRVLLYLLYGICGFILLLGRGILDMCRGLVVPLGKLKHALMQPVRIQMRNADRVQQNMRAARHKGKKHFAAALLKSAHTYLWGENGLMITIFHYVVPVASLAFLVGVVLYGAHLQYGLVVQYNGEEIGVIASEEEFDAAASEVHKRIADVELSEPLIYTPKFSLTIVNDTSDYVPSSVLADRMLSSSDAVLTQACGVFVDDAFVGAVASNQEVEFALSERLADFNAPAGATDVQYENAVTFRSGMYLEDSLLDTEEMIEKLTASERYRSQYTVQQGESVVQVAKKFSMAESELRELNPDLEEGECQAGDRLTVIKTNSFLPIQYTERMTLTSFIDFDSIEVNTSSVNKGDTQILVPGVKGEKSNVVDIVYVDGAEASRKVIRSEVLSEPVTEQVGIGTYTAQPMSKNTVLRGSGQFSWPVDGGYISDPFISDRNHKGLDIAAPAGTEIYAADAGTVTYAGWNAGGYGYLVMVDHGNGYVTVYGHCSMIYVSEGQEVSRGQRMAAVGSTGRSTGNHLHFEVRYNGMYCDPTGFLRVNAD